MRLHQKEMPRRSGSHAQWLGGDWTWEVVMLHLFSFLKGFFVQDEALGGSNISSTSQHQRDSGLAHERSHPGISRKKSGIGKPLVDSLAVNFPRVISFPW